MIAYSFRLDSQYNPWGKVVPATRTVRIWPIARQMLRPVLAQTMEGHP